MVPDLAVTRGGPAGIMESHTEPPLPPRRPADSVACHGRDTASPASQPGPGRLRPGPSRRQLWKLPSRRTGDSEAAVEIAISQFPQRPPTRAGLEAQAVKYRLRARRVSVPPGQPECGDHASGS